MQSRPAEYRCLDQLCAASAALRSTSSPAPAGKRRAASLPSNRPIKCRNATAMKLESTKHTQTELPRVLNASHATSIVVGIIIGSGIFLVPREMMAAVGSSSLVYTVWIVGGLLSLFGAMTYAEIAAARPKYGGEYAFLREAYGDLTGFLYMWTQITVAK